VWQKLREEIGEYNEDYFNSQKGESWVKKSSYEELEEDDFDEGEYAITKIRTLKDLW
jgi:hypothetical protein